jgi:hypothetical protein
MNKFGRLLQNSIEEGVWFPAAAGKKTVFRHPTSELSSQDTNGAADGTPTKTHQQRQGVFPGTAESSAIDKAMPPSIQNLAPACKQGHGSPLDFRQQAEGVGSGTDETILARHALGQGRDDRLTVQLDTMALGNQGKDFGDVQRVPGTVQYVMYYLYMRHTLTCFSGVTGRFLWWGTPQASQGI